MLQSCQHADENSVAESKKPDLGKAATYNMQLGLGYLKQGDRPRAKKKLLLALDQEPLSADVNAALAYYFEKTNELTQANKYYLKAISLSSASGAQLNNYGTFLCRQGDYGKAEVYFLRAVKDMEYINTAAAYENAGLCALAIPDSDKARLYFKTALDHDPSRKESLLELLKLERKSGHDVEAFNLLQKHNDLVLNDRILLEIAKELANKTENNSAVAQYETYFVKIGSTTSSGVNDDYDNRNG